MLKALFNNRAFQLASLLAFALVLNREGTWVPSGNEQIYLLYLYKAAHHGFLSTDWTFQEPTAGHLIFNVAFGWTTLEMNGNDMDEVLVTLDKARSLTGQGKPIAIMMHTIMGKGVDFMENDHHWHGVAPNDEQLAKALAQLPETLVDY